MAKEALTNASDDPWEKDCIEGVLKALVHSINPHGEYYDRLEAKSIRDSNKPYVEYAPAIILRKRSVKGLSETLKRIKDKIEKGEPIPAEFGDLAEIPQRSDGETSTYSEKSAAELDGEVYFPKPSNEAQRRIIEKIRAASGVLVQGPPGTGKSHTIANLICHLLATGQRILITAKTPRALQVLEGLLPDELRPLCINLLGDGLEEKRSLESSVRGILCNHEEWNEQRSNTALQELVQKLRQLREEKSQNDRRLRAIRESETHPQTVADGTYRGTAAQIALAVNEAESLFDWFADTVSIDKSCPISANDLHTVLGILRRLTPELRRELNLAWPNRLPSPERFAHLVINERKARDEEHAVEHEADMQVVAHLSRFNDNLICCLLEAFSKFQGTYRNLLALPYKWIQAAVGDILSNNPNLWRELQRVTRQIISSIKESVSLADSTEIKIPINVNEKATFRNRAKP